jgi:hypothetical protein
LPLFVRALPPSMRVLSPIVRALLLIVCSVAAGTEVLTAVL